jgi:hypothetical protein
MSLSLVELGYLAQTGMINKAEGPRFHPGMKSNLAPGSKAILSMNGPVAYGRMPAKQVPRGHFHPGMSSGNLAPGSKAVLSMNGPVAYGRLPGRTGTVLASEPLKSPGRLRGMATGTYGRRALKGGAAGLVLAGAGGGAYALTRKKKKVEKGLFNRSKNVSQADLEARMAPYGPQVTNTLTDDELAALRKTPRKLGRKGKAGLIAGGVLVPAAIGGEAYRRSRR